MHEEITVIEQNPLALVVAFDASGKVTKLLQLEADFVRDGLVLPRTCARADDEMVGEAGNASQIQNRDVSGFFRLCRADCNLPTLFGGLGRMKFCTSTFSDAGIDSRQKLAPIAIVL